MDYVAILALVQKGLSVAMAIYEAGKDAAPAVKAIKDIITGVQEDSLTDAQVAETEAILDAMIAEFNLEME
jgi:uncharacterized iron-regulated protein